MDVVLVHFRSGGMLLDAVEDLFLQDGVCLRVHVVECGDDGTVPSAVQRWPQLVVHDPKANLGYCGGNNLALRLVAPGRPVLIVNPDVRMPDCNTVQTLWSVLQSATDLAAVAPLIRTHTGELEYLGSVVDRRNAQAHHTQTMMGQVPPRTPAVLRLPWVNGACWLLRAEALADVGHLDEDFFLFYEEVDWALRASARGWGVGLITTTEVVHTRSASFGASTKGAYYYWRNRWLLFAKHGGSEFWRVRWAMDWLRFVTRKRHLPNGASLNALAGGLDAMRGRFGARPLRA